MDEPSASASVPEGTRRPEDGLRAILREKGEAARLVGDAETARLYVEALALVERLLAEPGATP